MLVALIALFVALGGTAVAGVANLHRGEVTTHTIHNGAVTTNKLHAQAVTGRKVAADTLTGRNIKESTLGTVPSAASAAPIAYAHVNSDGTVDARNSKDVTSSNISLDKTAAYCFHGLPFKVHGAVITIDYADPAGNPTDGVAEIALGDPFFDCASTPGTELEAETAEGGSFTPVSFYIVFY